MEDAVRGGGRERERVVEGSTIVLERKKKQARIWNYGMSGVYSQD